MSPWNVTRRQKDDAGPEPLSMAPRRQSKPERNEGSPPASATPRSQATRINDGGEEGGTWGRGRGRRPAEQAGGVPPPGARPGARRWRLVSGTNRLTKLRNRGDPGAGSARPLDEVPRTQRPGETRAGWPPPAPLGCRVRPRPRSGSGLGTHRVGTPTNRLRHRRSSPPRQRPPQFRGGACAHARVRIGKEVPPPF